MLEGKSQGTGNQQAAAGVGKKVGLGIVYCCRLPSLLLVFFLLAPVVVVVHQGHVEVLAHGEGTNPHALEEVDSRQGHSFFSGIVLAVLLNPANLWSVAVGPRLSVDVDEHEVVPAAGARPELGEHLAVMLWTSGLLPEPVQGVDDAILSPVHLERLSVLRDDEQELVRVHVAAHVQDSAKPGQDSVLLAILLLFLDDVHLLIDKLCAIAIWKADQLCRPILDKSLSLLQTHKLPAAGPSVGGGGGHFLGPFSAQQVEEDLGHLQERKL